jgi:hypothetical protein
LELRPAADDGMPPVTWDLDRWIDSFRDGGSAVRVKFAGGPLRTRLSTVKPGDLRAEMADADAGSPAADAGANVGEIGPAATDEKVTQPVPR